VIDLTLSFGTLFSLTVQFHWSFFCGFPLAYAWEAMKASEAALCAPRRISEIVQGKRSITADTALRQTRLLFRPLGAFDASTL